MAEPTRSAPEDATAASLDRLELAARAFRKADLQDSAALALQAAEFARQVKRADLLADAALVCEAVPDASTAATIERLCREALLALGDGDPVRSARLHGQLATALHHRERLDEAAEHVALALTLAEQTGDPLALVGALHAQGLSIAGLDRGAGLLELSGQMLLAAAASGSHHAEMIARGWRLEALVRLGETVAASHEIDSLEVLAEASARPLCRWNAHIARAGLNHALGRFDDAERHARLARGVLPAGQRRQTEEMFIAQTILIALDRGTTPAEIQTARATVVGGPLIAIAMMARYDLEMGDRTQAEAGLAAVRDRVENIGMDRRALVTVAGAVELAVAFGDHDLASALKRRLAPFDGALIASSVGAIGPVGYFLSRIASLEGNHDEAVAKADAAARLAARQGFGPWHARARLAHAEALIARGRPGDRARARHSASLSLATARQLGMTRLTERGQSVLDSLNPAGTLSRRELEIAGLVAAGGSNREIAAALGLSERTIETHVQHILTKLTFHSRAQIAAWAATRGQAVAHEAVGGGIT